MMEIFCFLVVSLFAGAIGLAFFLYHYRKGQFDDMEDPKYQLFREEDDAEIPK
ncbi:MAG: hypothetical protein K940chlam9_01434 [Chlamydiae bacterium]|nr:hypothetical protein [Chlamydiota bacterium]